MVAAKLDMNAAISPASKKPTTPTGTYCAEHDRQELLEVRLIHAPQLRHAEGQASIVSPAIII